MLLQLDTILEEISELADGLVKKDIYSHGSQPGKVEDASVPGA